jgi:hypothetical protein
MFDQLTAPAELWVIADQHYMPSIGGGDSAGPNSATVTCKRQWYES